MNDLAPCPFCGRTPELHHGHGDITYILCDGCGAVVSFRPNLKGKDSVRAYAKRAPLPKGALVRGSDGRQYMKVT